MVADTANAENEFAINLDKVFYEKVTEQKRLSNKLVELKPLHTVLSNLMVSRETSPKEYESLHENSRKLLRLFINKRKYTVSEDLSLVLINELRNEVPKKRSEEYVKYIFKKIIKFLKSMYRENIYKEFSVRLKKKKSRSLSFEYSFHEFYYGSISEKMVIKIEKFFHPRKNSSSLNRNLSKDKLDLVEKSISRIYLTYMKMSLLFMKHLDFFLDRVLFNVINSQIQIRLHDRLQSWEEEIKRKGFETFYTDLKFNFENNSRSKLCWSRAEIMTSVRHFKRLLSETF